MSLVLVLKELAQRPSFPSLPQFCLFVCLLWGALFPRTADPFPNPYAFTLYSYRTSCNWTVLQAKALLARYFGSLGSSQSQRPAER